MLVPTWSSQSAGGTVATTPARDLSSGQTYLVTMRTYSTICRSAAHIIGGMTSPGLPDFWRCAGALPQPLRGGTV
jgi:hypothetical protein